MPASNPCRFGYFRDIYMKLIGEPPSGRAVLDVGCGGGLLAEEFARVGFSVTGVDPSEPSLATARRHADRSALAIDYRWGVAESLPFTDASFDIVYCCDVLEHVRDPARAVAEISRVLRPGGLFLFDTINRTPLSRLIIIKVWQEWKSTALVHPGLHVYEMFIRPDELREMCAVAGMDVGEFRGMTPNVNPLKLVQLLRRRARGKLSYAEFGRAVSMVESSDLKVGYMGYAIKR